MRQVKISGKTTWKNLSQRGRKSYFFNIYQVWEIHGWSQKLVEIIQLLTRSQLEERGRWVKPTSESVPQGAPPDTLTICGLLWSAPMGFRRRWRKREQCHLSWTSFHTGVLFRPRLCWKACLCFLRYQSSEYIKIKDKYYKDSRFSSEFLSAQQNNLKSKIKSYICESSITASFRKLLFCKCGCSILSVGSLLFWSVQGDSDIMIASCSLFEKHLFLFAYCSSYSLPQFSQNPLGIKNSKGNRFSA